MDLTWLFLTKILQIIVIDTVLSGDNAVVIALAAHRLPYRQRRLAIFFGAGGAIGLRVLFTFILTQLLNIPLLQFGGGLVLLWIAAKLLLQEEDAEEIKVREAGSLPQAIRTIILADFVMSLDNMLAVAGAAKQDLLLIMVGLFVSIAIIMTCSSLIAELMNRFPIAITAGAAVLAWTAGDMMVDDAKAARFLIERSQLCISMRWHRHFEDWFGENLPQFEHRHWMGWAMLVALVVFVITFPYWWRALISKGPTKAALPTVPQPDPPGSRNPTDQPGGP